MKKLVAICIALTLLLAGCGGGAPKSESIYYGTFAGDYKTFNPYTLRSTTGYLVVANSMDSLVENDKYGRVVPSLAESWTVNDDFTKWTFQLRKGIHWVNDKGEKTEYEVTADDFVEGIRFIADPKNESKNFSIVGRVIDGLKDYYWALSDIDDGTDKTTKREEVLASFDSKVGVKAIDSHTVEYTLSGPTPFFTSYLVTELFYPVEPKFLAQVGEDYGTAKEKMLYNGAYYIKTWDRDKLLVLAKNEYYWDKEHVGIVELNLQKVGDEITSLEMFQRGETTGCSVSAEQLKALKGTEWEDYIYLKDKTTVTFWFTMNHDSKNPEFNAFVGNLNFRKALMHAIDRVKISALYEPNNPEWFIRNTIIPEEAVYDAKGVDYTDYPALKPFKEAQSYHPEKAKEFMMKAVAELTDGKGAIKGLTPSKVDMGKIANFDSDGKLPVDLVLATTSDPMETKKALLIAEMLKQNLGPENINVIVGYSTMSFQDEVFTPMDFDLVDDSYAFRFADPSANLARLVSDGSLNEGMYDVPQFDQMVEQASKESDLTKRYELFSQAEAYMLDNVYLIPYMTGGGSYFMSKELPYQTAKGKFGLSAYKMKNAVIQSTPVTKKQYEELKKQYEAELEQLSK